MYTILKTIIIEILCVIAGILLLFVPMVSMIGIAHIIFNLTK